MILDEITREKYKQIEDIKTVHRSLIRELQNSELTIIAEMKKASPSRGLINGGFTPSARLSIYQKAGVGAVSILTDRKFFDGHIDIIKNLHSLSKIPILRKDFIIDPLQLYESRLAGADVILLIAKILDQNKIELFLNIAREIGLQAIVEVHNIQELNKVLNTSARIIGINNRNLNDFTVDLQTTKNIILELKKKNKFTEYLIVSESGIHSREDIKYLTEMGIDGVLVGESLMQAENSEQKIKKLLGKV